MTAKAPKRRETTPATSSVGAYKKVLMSVLEQRPSGTRRKLAEALGKNRSFVSQFSHPGYKTPIPSRHLDTIFDICHFSPREKERFLKAYRSAHPRWAEGRQAPAGRLKITIEVPDLGHVSSNEALERLVREFAASAAGLMQHANGNDD